MQILIPENTHIILRLLSKFFGRKYARKFLKLNKNIVEVNFDIYKFLDRDFDIREKSLTRFKDKKNKKIVNTSKVFHGYSEENPIYPYLKINLARDNIERCVKMLKSEIDIISILRNKEDVPSVLVQHLGFIDKNKPNEGMKKIFEVLEKILPYARKKKVIISLENLFNFFYDGTYSFGSNFEDLERIMKRVEEIGFEDNIGITFDMGHALIENRGDYKKIENFIKKNARYINYSHIHYPIKNFNKWHPVKPIGIKIFDLLRVPDGHRSIVKAFKNNEFRNIIKLLAEETRIKETKCIGLEITSRWNWLWFFYKKGSSLKEIYESYKLLDEFINFK